MFRRPIFLNFLILVAVVFATTASASTLYWSSENGAAVREFSLDVPGATPQSLVNGMGFPSGIAIDPAASFLYWTDPAQDRIARIPLGGGVIEPLITGPIDAPHPFDLRLDLGAGKMYWADDTLKRIRRANLDGTDIEDVVLLSGRYTGASIYGIDLDPANGHVYWSDRFSGRILRANLTPLDPNGAITVLVEGNFFNGTGPSAPFGFRLDLVHGKMYWADTVQDVIQRANLDGSLVENIITKNSFTDPNFKFSPFGLAMDAEGGQLYWTNKSNTPNLGRALLDGSGISEILNFSGGDPLAIEIVAAAVTATPELGPQMGFGAPFPNPFNPRVVFPVDLNHVGNVDLSIVDLRGRAVAHLLRGPLLAGHYEIPWTGVDTAGRGVASGVYVGRLRVDGVTIQRRVSLVR